MFIQNGETVIIPSTENLLACIALSSGPPIRFSKNAIGRRVEDLRTAQSLDFSMAVSRLTAPSGLQVFSKPVGARFVISHRSGRCLTGSSVLILC